MPSRRPSDLFEGVVDDRVGVEPSCGLRAAVDEERGAERHVVGAEDLLVQVERLDRPGDARLVDRCDAVLVEVGDQLMETALDPLGADDVRGDLAHHHVEEPGLPEVALVEIDLIAGRPTTGDRLGGDVERGDRRAVEVELMARPLPDARSVGWR